MILGIEIALIVLGLKALITGSLPVGSGREAEGVGARVAGLLMLLPIPVALLVFNQFRVNGTLAQMEQIQLIGIEAGILAGFAIVGYLIALFSSFGGSSGANKDYLHKGSRYRAGRDRSAGIRLSGEEPSYSRPRRKVPVRPDEDDEEDEGDDRPPRKSGVRVDRGRNEERPRKRLAKAPVRPDDEDEDDEEDPRPRRRKAAGGSGAGLVIGLSVGGGALVLILLFAIIFAFRSQDGPAPVADLTPPGPGQQPIPVFPRNEPPVVQEPNPAPLPNPPPPPPPPPPPAPPEWLKREMPLGAEAASTMVWADNGKQFYVVEKQSGKLNLVSLDDFQIVQSVNLGGPCSYLSMSREGLVATLVDQQALAVVDPQTLAVKNTIKVAKVKQAASAPTLGQAFAEVGTWSDPFELAIVDLATSQITPVVQAKTARGLFAAPVVSSDGAYLFTKNQRGNLLRTRITPPNGLRMEEESGRLENGRPAPICLSNDGKYVCLPTGGGTPDSLPLHPPARSYSTYIYQSANLKQPLCLVEQGAHPEYMAIDPQARLIYAHNHSHHLKVFDFTGALLKDYQLPEKVGAVRGYLVHPEGRKLLILTERRLVLVQLPPMF
jgi:hypothetical protein